MAEHTVKEPKTITVQIWKSAVHSIPVTDSIELPEGADVKDLTDMLGGDAAVEITEKGTRTVKEGPLEEGYIYQVVKYDPTSN